MKIRNGFVSNSSSSSFILMLDKIPTSIEEMKKILYGENATYFTTYWNDDAISTDEVAQIVLNSIKNTVQLDINDMVEQVKDEIRTINEYNIDGVKKILEGSDRMDEVNELIDKILIEEQLHDNFRKDFWKVPDRDKKHELREKEYERHYNTLNELSEPIKDIIKEHYLKKYTKENLYFPVTFSDNDGETMSYIEHSGVLDKVSIAYFNHH